jgi:hypothetical protein
MRSTCVLLTCLCLIMLAVPASAADQPSAHPKDPQAMMETYKKLATPGAPHQQLASLAGRWTTTTKAWMEPNTPPMESTGACDYTVLLGGRYVQQACSGEMMGQPFTGIGVHGYDNVSQKYVTTWIDSMGTGIFVMDGTASPDGKTITLTGSHADPFEGVMTHRAIWTFVDAKTQTFEMYGEHGSGHETKMMEITYTRKP